MNAVDCSVLLSIPSDEENGAGRDSTITQRVAPLVSRRGDEITEFVGGSVPSPVEFQAVLDATASGIVYRPSGGTVETSHTLEAGVYTVSFEANQVDTQKLRLEVDAEFIPPLPGQD